MDLGLNPVTGALSSVGRITEGLDSLFSSDHELSQEETARKREDTEQLRERTKVELANIGTVLAAIGVEKERARSPSLFVAGARPFGEWVLNAGLAYGIVLAPLLNWCVAMGAWIAGVESIPAQAFAPEMDWSQIAAMGGARGVTAGWRSWEKRGGVARENMQSDPYAGINAQLRAQGMNPYEHRKSLPRSDD